jgi:glycosyltransferase involved in cell wall biosynthesis
MLKTALVHEWLTGWGGAESCVQSISKLWPMDAYVLVHDPAFSSKSEFQFSNLKSSFIQRLPFAKKKYRSYFPLFPIAVEQHDLSSYELILSSSHISAKGGLISPHQLHICYCYSPARYAWDLQHEYLRESGLTGFSVKAILARYFLHKFRTWDYISAVRVDHFIAISKFIASRIKRVYGREAAVIYPPVDVDQFTLSEKSREDFYFTVSRFVPYKRVDLIVDAFKKMPDKKLVVAGDGPDAKKIRKLAGPNVELLGEIPRDQLIQHMQKSRAFIFAAQEDFGIVPVEAQACGTPVIAYGKGGALETVISGETGEFFNEQNTESLYEAISKFENSSTGYSPQACRQNAERFSRVRFEQEMRDFIKDKWKLHQKSSAE